MTYSLFDDKCSFTQVLHGKSDAELAKERNITFPSIDSGEEDPAKNYFILKVLDSLLEVFDPRAIRLPTHIPPPPIVPRPLRSSPCAPSVNTFVPPPIPRQNHQVPTHLLPSPMGEGRRWVGPSPITPGFYSFPPPKGFVVPPSCFSQHQIAPPQFVQCRPPVNFIPVPFIPTPQMMSIPPPPIGYFH